jgi:hypothetical protein
MHNMAGVPIASEDIFSTTVSGQPKSEILIDLQREHPGMEKYHFVEDKLSTLEKVSAKRGPCPKYALLVTMLCCSACVKIQWKWHEPRCLSSRLRSRFAAEHMSHCGRMMWCWCWPGLQGGRPQQLAAVPGGLGLQHRGGKAESCEQPTHLCGQPSGAPAGSWLQCMMAAST